MNQRGITPLLVIIILGVFVVLAFLISRITGIQNPVSEVTRKASNAIMGGDGFDFDKETPGYENYTQLMQGCSFKDCIPSIDDPKFEPVDNADEWLEEDSVVFVLELGDLLAAKYPDKVNVLEYGNIVRAYPQRIMNWHEIVNDEMDGEPVVVTFCPLCGSALAFDRNMNKKVLEFGVSGKLHNNDLVMYDRQTETLWQQITGEAMVGELFGGRLKQIPMSGMRWSQFKEEFPNGEVLSRDTGFSRNYDRYPYGDYEQDRSPLFPISGGVDETIHPKTMVYGVEVDKNYKAYPEDKLKNLKTEKLRDKVGRVDIEISYKNGNVKVERLDTKEEIPATRLFWFAWKAFRPETELY